MFATLSGVGQVLGGVLLNKKLVGSFISLLLAFAGLVVAQPAQALVLNLSLIHI